MNKKLNILFILLALMINVNAALIHTSGDGNWSNTGTWTGGALPGVSDDVQIDNNDLFVDISWTTASEINNDFFTIQRFDDGVNYMDISRIDGFGNSNSLINYKALKKISG